MDPVPDHNNTVTLAAAARRSREMPGGEAYPSTRDPAVYVPRLPESSNADSHSSSPLSAITATSTTSFCSVTDSLASPERSNSRCVGRCPCSASTAPRLQATGSSCWAIHVSCVVDMERKKVIVLRNAIAEASNFSS